MPEIFINEIITNIQDNMNEGLLSQIISDISEIKMEKNNDRRRRRLSIASYSVEVENKYGRNIRYVTNINFGIVA